MSFNHDHLMKTEQIFDDFQGKCQAVINCEVSERLKKLEGDSGDPEANYIVVDSLPDRPEEGEEDKIYLIPTDTPNVYDSYKWNAEEGKFDPQGRITVPDSAIFVTKEEADRDYVRKDDPSAVMIKEVDGKKVLVLPESAQIMGTIGAAIYALLSLRTYNQESGESITQAEVGNTSYHLNLNSFDNVTVDTPEGKKTLAFTEDLSNFLKIVKIDGKDVVSLPQNVQLMGTVRDAIYALVSLRVYNEGTEEETVQVEIGTTNQHLNLNTIDDITYDTPKGKKRLVNEDQIRLMPVDVNIPIRTLKDQIYPQEEILGWFGVQDIASLKDIIANKGIQYLRYGIILSYNPHYYKMPVQYAAFESESQVKLVCVGLDTSDDSVSRYEIIMNLDGTVIEGNSNVKLTLDHYAKTSDLPSYTIVDLDSDYVIPANPTTREVTYEIHVGSEVHNITGAEGIRWQNNELPAVQADHVYAVSVINNLAVWGEF